MGIGRKSPRVPGRLESVVRHPGGAACRFAGCERRISLLSHHLRHWADGGATDVDNLVTLCAPHHRYVDEDGWRISGDPHADLRFHDPTPRAPARASLTTSAA
ncbi:MAG TPA: HNH endonuclease [Actinomycetota bacterium]|nr:HNH endonuclease [Actinomycetota bacterium]